MKRTRPTAVIDIVGLTGDLLDLMPHLTQFSKKSSLRKIRPVFPALTCSAQATYLTGLNPSDHGIVGNGWYYKDVSQVMLWKQSHSLMSGEKLWESARKIDPSFTSANLFWWFNMYSSVNYAVTPRPTYRADGLKLPDIYTSPPSLRADLQNQLGAFPLFHFWGPAADLRSSQWIADASISVAKDHHPSLLLVYLPHLDYCLQKEGPNGPGILKEVLQLDQLCHRLIQELENEGYQIVLLSEYGIQPVQGAIRINELFRKKGWLTVRQECNEDHFDAGASEVFAAADHQIAHIYIKNPEQINCVRQFLESQNGISKVLDTHSQAKLGIQNARSGDLIAVAQNDRWFSYRYWLDDRKAPDFARTVDIHRKPGYDPVELFLEQKHSTRIRMGARLLAKKLGFRYRMDVISLDESLVKGSHGSTDTPEKYWPILISQRSDLFNCHPSATALAATDVKGLLLQHLFERDTHGDHTHPYSEQ